MSDCFEVTVRNKVAHLILNRPDELNTMVPEFWLELPRIVRDLDASGDVRAMVLSSTGKHFCAGMDLSVFAGDSELLGNPGVEEAGRVRAHLFETVLKLQGCLSVLSEVRFPVLAAIQGGCIGGAVDLVTAADMRYATTDAFFCIQEINIGMTADVGTLQRLPKLIPEGIARELAFTGDRMSAARAREVGLVNEVIDGHEALIEHVMAVAERIASKSPLAIWGTKEMINYARDHSEQDSLRHVAAWQSGMFQPADMMESFAAKSERREPAFPDLPRRALPR